MSTPTLNQDKQRSFSNIITYQISNKFTYRLSINKKLSNSQRQKKNRQIYYNQEQLESIAKDKLNQKQIKNIFKVKNKKSRNSGNSASQKLSKQKQKHVQKQVPLVISTQKSIKKDINISSVDNNKLDNISPKLSSNQQMRNHVLSMIYKNNKSNSNVNYINHIPNYPNIAIDQIQNSNKNHLSYKIKKIKTQDHHQEINNKQEKSNKNIFKKVIKQQEQKTFIPIQIRMQRQAKSHQTNNKADFQSGSKSKSILSVPIKKQRKKSFNHNSNNFEQININHNPITQNNQKLISNNIVQVKRSSLSSNKQYQDHLNYHQNMRQQLLSQSPQIQNYNQSLAKRSSNINIHTNGYYQNKNLSNKSIFPAIQISHNNKLLDKQQKIQIKQRHSQGDQEFKLNKNQNQIHINLKLSNHQIINKATQNHHLTQKKQIHKKKKLNHYHKLYPSSLSKPGSNTKGEKKNQDAFIIQQKLPLGIKFYCVCDGHGANGHFVSDYIKQILPKNLAMLLKRYSMNSFKIHQKQDKQKDDDTNKKMIEVFKEAFQKTNSSLLNSDINTELSGSTVIGVFFYKEMIFCLNVGDSRAILINMLDEKNKSNSKRKQQYFLKNNWSFTELSFDQTPQRSQQRKRILKFGEIRRQKDEHGNPIGPQRVWKKQLNYPGLAMTRSFGDKAGVKAGTISEAQVISYQLNSDEKINFQQQQEQKQYYKQMKQKCVVIASDGIWQYLTNERVSQIIGQIYEKQILARQGLNEVDYQKFSAKSAEAIVNQALQKWEKYCYTRDDITVIVVLIRQIK